MFELLEICIINFGLYHKSFFSDCPTGTFGSDCGYNCSGHCIGDIPCNRTTGRCDTGCKPGYTGDLCDRGLIKCKIDKKISFYKLLRIFFGTLLIKGNISLS